MIAFLKQERFIILFVLAAFIFHLFQKDIRDSYQKPITGDAQAYYSYLPAIFIYNDLEYKFIETDAAQYYPADGIKDFRFESNGKIVNKTFPGVAVLYAPFFFAAHVTAHVFGFEADGFSNIYQLFFDLGLWFYFLFGLIFLRKFLKKTGIPSKIALFSTILIGFGTNMFFYTVYDQSVTHIYNFFLINGMLLCLANWEVQKKTKWLIFAVLLLALIGITRPTNILVFGLILYFFGKKQFFSDVFRSIFGKKWWIYVISVLPLLAIPFLLWKAQTGKWIVYSYGEEGFDFTKPHFFEFLFSYTKGWMTYTPIVIPIFILGGIALFKKSKRKFAIALGFYVLCIYVFSSWWCWYYGAGMSQRVMIDHYVLLATLLTLGLKLIWDKKIWRNAYLTLLILLGVFNMIQAHQIMIGVIKNGSTTKDGYWDSFLVLEKRARVYPPENWELMQDLPMSAKGFVTQVSAEQPFSAGFTEKLKFCDTTSKLVISWEAKAISEVTDTRGYLILEHEEDTLQDIMPYFLKEFVQKDEWVEMEFLFEPQRNYKPFIEIYFWNGYTQEQIEFRNVGVRHFKENKGSNY